MNNLKYESTHFYMNQKNNENKENFRANTPVKKPSSKLFTKTPSKKEFAFTTIDQE